MIFPFSYMGGSSAVAPSNTVAPVASGTAIVGQTLSVTDGTWTGTAPITYSYQWKRNNVDIGGATNATYVLVSADSEAAIKCTVTATNTAGNASQDSNELTVAIDPSALAGMQLWLKADAGVTLVGGQVDVWADQSGNGNNATAPSSLKRPEYNSNGINGKPTVYNHSANSVGVSLNLLSTINKQNFTILLVSKKTNADGDNRSIIGSGNSSQFLINTGNVTYGTNGLYSSSTKFCDYSIGNAYLNSEIAQNAIIIDTIRCSGTTVKQKVNNLTEKTGTKSGIQPFILQYLFKYTVNGNITYDFTGDIAEIIIYDNSISDSDAAKLQVYANTKYSVY